MKISEIQRERWFILGIIEGENKKGKKVIEAVKIYNPVTDEGKIESLNSIGKRIEAGEEVIGARIRKTKRYSEKRGAYMYYEETVLTEQCFKYKQLPILNGAGDIVKPGKGVVVGSVEKNGQLKFIVINNSLKKQYLSKEDILSGGYVGTFRNNIMRASQMRVDLLKNEEA